MKRKNGKRRKKLKLRSSGNWTEKEKDRKRLLKMSFVYSCKRKKGSGKLRCKGKEVSRRCKSKRSEGHLVQVQSVAKELVSTREPGTGSNVTVVKCGFIVFVWRYLDN